MLAKRYKIDFSSLEKGSIITEKEIEQWCGVSRSSRDFPLHILKLRGIIEDHFKRRGEEVNTRCDKGAIKICLDDEGSKVTYSRFKGHIAGLQRSFEQMNRTDVSQLDSRQKQEHLRSVEIAGNVLAAVDTVTRGLPDDERPSWYLSTGY